eukprot:926847-Amphidinium_carterae.1
MALASFVSYKNLLLTNFDRSFEIWGKPSLDLLQSLWGFNDIDVHFWHSCFAYVDADRTETARQE